MQQGACRLIPGIIRKTSRQQLTPKRGRQRGGGTYVTRAPPSSAHMRSAIRISARCSDAAFVPMFSVLLYLFVMKVLEGHGDALWSVTLFATLQGPLRSTVTKVEHIFVISLLSAYVRCVARSPLLNKVNRFNPKHVRPRPTRTASS